MGGRNYKTPSLGSLAAYRSSSTSMLVNVGIRNSSHQQPHCSFTCVNKAGIPPQHSCLLSLPPLPACQSFLSNINMASAARIPLKTVLFTATLALGVSASRVNLRDFLIRTFTGPGSYSRIIAATLVLANLKNVPFAWHVGSPFFQASSKADCTSSASSTRS